MPNTNRFGRIIGSDLTSHFETPQSNRKEFLHCIVTSDEKWVHYDNPKRRKSWGMPGHASTSTARPNIHGAKVMLCIWWDELSVVYYELLKPSETITGDRYRTQFMRLSRGLRENRPHYQERHDKVILQHENSRPHVARPAKTYLKTLKWKVLPHPPYFLDVVLMRDRSCSRNKTPF